MFQWVDWDQRHTAVLVLNYTKNDWNYSLMGQYGSGLPYYLAYGVDTAVPRRSQFAEESRVHDLQPEHLQGSEGRMAALGHDGLERGNVFNARTVLDRDADGEPTARRRTAIRQYELYPTLLASDLALSLESPGISPPGAFLASMMGNG